MVRRDGRLKSPPSTMKYSLVYARCESARKVVAWMYVLSAVAIIADIATFIWAGLGAGFIMCLLTSMVFCLAEIFDFLVDVFGLLGRMDEDLSKRMPAATPVPSVGGGTGGESLG